MTDHITKINFNGYGDARLHCHGLGWADVLFQVRPTRVTVLRTNIQDPAVLQEVVLEFRHKELE